MKNNDKPLKAPTPKSNINSQSDSLKQMNTVLQNQVNELIRLVAQEKLQKEILEKKHQKEVKEMQQQFQDKEKIFKKKYHKLKKKLKKSVEVIINLKKSLEKQRGLLPNENDLNIPLQMKKEKVKRDEPQREVSRSKENQSKKNLSFKLEQRTDSSRYFQEKTNNVVNSLTLFSNDQTQNEHSSKRFSMNLNSDLSPTVRSPQHQMINIQEIQHLKSEVDQFTHSIKKMRRDQQSMVNFKSRQIDHLQNQFSNIQSEKAAQRRSEQDLFQRMNLQKQADSFIKKELNQEQDQFSQKLTSLRQQRRLMVHEQEFQDSREIREKEVLSMIKEREDQNQKKKVSFTMDERDQREFQNNPYYQKALENYRSQQQLQPQTAKNEVKPKPFIGYNQLFLSAQTPKF